MRGRGEEETEKKWGKNKAIHNSECSVLSEQRKTNILSFWTIQHSYPKSLFFSYTRKHIFKFKNKVNNSKLSVLDTCNLFLPPDSTLWKAGTYSKECNQRPQNHDYIQETGRLIKAEVSKNV